MSMGMGGGMGAAGMAMMRSMRRDPSVSGARLSKGVLRRIWEFARPFRWSIAGFLVLVVIDALLVVATPLLLQRIIDVGIGQHNRQVVVTSALLVAVNTVRDARLRLVQRDLFPRIREGEV